MTLEKEFKEFLIEKKEFHEELSHLIIFCNFIDFIIIKEPFDNIKGENLEGLKLILQDFKLNLHGIYLCLKGKNFLCFWTLVRRLQEVILNICLIFYEGIDKKVNFIENSLEESVNRIFYFNEFGNVQNYLVSKNFDTHKINSNMELLCEKYKINNSYKWYVPFMDKYKIENRQINSTSDFLKFYGLNKVKKFNVYAIFSIYVHPNYYAMKTSLKEPEEVYPLVHAMYMLFTSLILRFFKLEEYQKILISHSKLV